MKRQSVLNDRHRALGSKLDSEIWNMPIPQSYSTDPYAEALAVRSAAGLFDISALNIVNVSGPDAADVLDKLAPIDVKAMRHGTARLAALVNDKGQLSDDLMIIRDGENEFRLSHGGGNTQEQLARVAEGRNVKWEQNFDVHMMSLQGPRAAAILKGHIDTDVATLPYFEHRATKLFGRNVILSRGGYSGEEGFEISCASADAVALWDALMDTGKPHGLMAASWDALEIVRVEAALLFYPFDMPEGDTTPWEVNLGWAVDADKQGDYIGKQALLAARGKERFFQAGVSVKADRAMEAGAQITVDGKDAGVVTSTMFSQHLMQSLALVHLKPEYRALGTRVEIADSQGTCTGYVTRTPFYDPQRIRTRVQGA
ncbi:aminomethyl transferase family protein [Imbroritus primus]|uniref:Aminomethyl transferase family protein n=1 Tax=Imbroritus primus TaxID=3058603 RepID=A0ACD3SMU4_9BURK|nr:aminomethyl transferase family protein [Burkholderiaceae bacterium PBA]